MVYVSPEQFLYRPAAIVKSQFAQLGAGCASCSSEGFLGGFRGPHGLLLVFWGVWGSKELFQAALNLRDKHSPALSPKYPQLLSPAASTPSPSILLPLQHQIS